VNTKKWYIIAICIVFTSQVFAEQTTFGQPKKSTFKRTTIQEKNNNWLPQGAPSERPNGLDREEPIDPNILPQPHVPIGDALPFLLSLGLIYGIYSYTKKEKS